LTAEQAGAPMAPQASMADDALMAEPDDYLRKKIPVKALAVGAAVVAGALVALYFLDLSEEAEGASEISDTAQPAETPQPAAAPVAEKPEEPKAEPPAAAESPETATADKAESAEPDQPAAQPEPEPKADEQPQTVKLVTKLMRIRGGALDQGKVIETVQGTFPQMERCYKKARKQRPRLQGRVVLAWTVKTSGRVAGARRVGGTIKNRAFAGCLAGAIKKARFPKPRRKNARVQLPFVFKKTGM
jgi:TonB family protein